MQSFLLIEISTDILATTLHAFWNLDKLAFPAVNIGVLVTLTRSKCLFNKVVSDECCQKSYSIYVCLTKVNT